MEPSKSPLKSKTLWVNLIAVGAMLAQGYTGFVVGPESQAALLGVVNIALRAVTRSAIDWKKVGDDGRVRLGLPVALVVTGLLLSLTLMLGGCAGLSTGNKSIDELVVRAATARVLHDHPTWIAETVRITDNALERIDGKQIISLDRLEQEVIADIDWESLLPEEQAIVQTLLTAVRQGLEDHLAASGVTDPAAHLVPVRQVVVWINSTAALRN